MSGAEEVPDITVELEDRRPVFAESTLAGIAAGLALLLVVRLELAAVAAIGFPVVVDAGSVGTQWAFHLLFATVLGSLFGLVVDSRPLWMYGRGFLGPLVGAAFGLLLWVVVGVVVWPTVLTVLPIPLGLGTTPPLSVSVTSYLAYGVMLGTFLNLFAMARI